SRIFGSARSKGLAYNVSAYGGVGKYDSSWDLAGQVNHETASDLFDIIAREMRYVLDGKLSELEIDSAKSFALGRYQMGAQTVSQISNFYTNRYFADDSIEDYDKVPDMIRKVSGEKIRQVAQDFINANTWVLAAVSSGERQELLELGEKLEPLFTVE